ncbi:MAG: lipopolysaccharide biosynthesis protein [Bacteroidota bacterium]
MSPDSSASSPPEVPRPSDPSADRLLDPSALREGLESRSVRSGFLTVTAQAVQAVLGVGAAMILARLLTPEDFGLLAMVMSLTALIQSVRNFGLPMAVVHREELTHGEASALFWLNAKLSGLIGLFVCAMAPVLAWFYDEVRLLEMTLVVAVGLVALGLAAQHRALLTRAQRFGTLAAIDVAGVTTGMAVGIGAAVAGLGYWALVLQFVVTHLIHAGGAWLSAGWQPRRAGASEPSPESGVQRMVSYGFQYSGSTILNHVSRNLDRVLVGFFSGPTAVGLYDNAYRWSIFPLYQLYKPLDTVAVSGLSRVQTEPVALRRYFQSGAGLVLAVSMPTVAFIFAETHDVVLILLGDQWLGAVLLLKILSVNAFLRTVTKLTPWLYLSEGQTRRQLQWSLIHAPVLIVAVSVGVMWGPAGVATGFTMATALLLWPELRYCLRTSSLSGRDLWGAVWRPLVASLVAVVATIAFEPPAGWPLIMGTAADAGVFGLTYVLTWVGMPGGRQALADVWRIASSLRGAAPPSSSA